MRGDSSSASGDQLASFGVLASHSSAKAPRISRDEMNLAEFPLTVLSTRAEPNVKTLEFSDTVRGKNGEVVNRNWIITGADKFGLPTSSDDEVLLGLLKLTVDDGFTSPKVFFSRYELLKILRWTTEGRSYTRLQKALDRLSGVRIKATNAFFDNESKSHSTRNFGLVDAYEINDGRDLGAKPSFFIWSEVLFKSFQVGFIKKFDLDFYLELRSAVSKRLYRYLDKHFWYRSSITSNLFTLAHEKIGISRNYKYASSLRQQLDPAAEELVAAGFLERFEYVGRGATTEVVFYAARGKPRITTQLDDSSAGDSSKVVVAKNRSRADEAQQSPEVQSQRGNTSETIVTELMQQLVIRGIKESQALRLLATKKTGVALDKVAAIVAHFDELVATKSARVSRSPVGFLYRAVERSDEFVLPDAEKIARAGASDKKRSSHPAATVVSEHRKTSVDPIRQQYEEYRRGEIERLWDTTENSLLTRLHVDAERALDAVKNIISDDAFRQTVTHKVEETLCQLFAVPTFDDWKRRNRPTK